MMISKTKYLLRKINSTLSDTLQDITLTYSVVKSNESNQTFSKDNDESGILTTQTKTDRYHFLPTSLITSDNITQSTMSRNIVSAFTVDDGGGAFDKLHHTTMVAVLLGIFTCISITLTVSVFVFCRKKNSVFMLQKCEQDSDIDLEMNDMNTEVETSDSEYEFIESSSPKKGTRRSQTCPNLSKYGENIDESCQPLKSDKYNRSSLKSKNLLTGSPTSRPLLLNSTSYTNVNPSIADCQISQSLSIDFTNNTGATAEKTSGKKYIRNNKHKHDNIDKLDTKETCECNSFLNKGKSNKKAKPGKYKQCSSLKQPVCKHFRNLEYETVEIHSDKTGTYKPNVGATKCNEVNTSILRMKIMEDDTVYISDGEIHILDHLDGKQEIL